MHQRLEPDNLTYNDTISFAELTLNCDLKASLKEVTEYKALVLFQHRVCFTFQ